MNRQIFKASKKDSAKKQPDTRGPGEKTEKQPSVSQTEDQYLDRLLKLIPGETVALYIFLQGVIMSALKNNESELQIWLWGIFIVLIIGNILFLKKFSDISDTSQLVVLTIAFIVWVFTIGGPFSYLNFYKPFMGSIVLGLFTFFIPLIYKGVPISE